MHRPPPSPQPAPAARAALEQLLAGSPEGFVRAAGFPVSVRAEAASRPSQVDHVWIQIDTGVTGIVRLSIPTWSRKNQNANFDARIRVGILRATRGQTPEPGITLAPPSYYETLESTARVVFEEKERAVMELLLIEKAKQAELIEAVGELYVRDHVGIHELHSRRASCAVTEDIEGRDGFLRFYFATGTVETLLLKFCGQA